MSTKPFVQKLNFSATCPPDHVSCKDFPLLAFCSSFPQSAPGFNPKCLEKKVIGDFRGFSGVLLGSAGWRIVGVLPTWIRIVLGVRPEIGKNQLP